MADETAKIRAHDVCVYYGDKKAVDEVSIDISPKYVTAFIGPSGCGKSTFLRCFNRMNDTIATAKVTGLIELDGEDIHGDRMDVVQLRARRDGVSKAEPVSQVDLRKHRIRPENPWIR